MADSGAYGGSRSLSANSAVMLLSAALWYQDTRNWEGAGYELTDDEIDQIATIVDLAQYEIMTGQGVGMASYVLLAENESAVNVGSLSIEDWADDYYSRYELVIQGIQSSSGAGNTDPVELTFDDITTVAIYSTVSQLTDNGGVSVVQDYLTQNGIFLRHSAGTLLGGGDRWGNCRIVMYQPFADEYMRVDYRGSFIDGSEDDNGMGIGYGLYRQNPCPEKITITPYSGAVFVAAPSSVRPDLLKMSLYGVT
ncbi:hypothetical protein KAR91_68880 [Candidatus Pacearchaeota archaeon]|nr:hypothetical protein [Candidatus Pacearchaeota archaeon]